MTRRRDIRTARQDAAKRDYLALEPDERDDEQHDGWQPVRERERLPMREGEPLDLSSPWRLPA